MTFFVLFQIEIVSLFTFALVYRSGWADAIDSCHSLYREHYNGHQNEFSMFLSIPRIRFEASFRSSLFTLFVPSWADCRRIRFWFAPNEPTRCVFIAYLSIHSIPVLLLLLLFSFCFVSSSRLCDRARYRIAWNAYNNSGNRIYMTTIWNVLMFNSQIVKCKKPKSILFVFVLFFFNGNLNRRHRNMKHRAANQQERKKETNKEHIIAYER